MSSTWAFDRKYKGWLVFRYADPARPHLNWRASFHGYEWNEVVIDMTLYAPTLEILKIAISHTEFKK